MMFPNKKFPDAGTYLDAYAIEVAKALQSVDREQIHRASRILADTIARDAQIFACGNGGSAAISNHLACDHSKGIATDTAMRPRVHSLSTCIELITAIANDRKYSDIFAYQLSLLARPGDALIAISASGKSENICCALRWARDNGLKTIALVGFTGGDARTLADIAIHVAAHNYGVVEDVHQSIMHVLAQFARHAVVPDADIGRIHF